MQTVVLKPYSPSSFQSLQFEIELRPVHDLIYFQFRLHGSKEHLKELVWPESKEAARCDGLWMTTVFELFIGRESEPGYLEFNFSPSGDWNTYRFTGERQEMNEATELTNSAVTSVTKTATMCEVHGVIDRVQLGLQGPLDINATSILDFGEHKEYWAAAHKSEKPDFHKRSGFSIRVM